MYAYTCLVSSKGKSLRAEFCDVGQHSLYHVTDPQKVDFIRNSQISSLVEEGVLSAVKSWSGAFSLSFIFLLLMLFFVFLIFVFQFISVLCLFTVMIRVVQNI